MKIVSNTGRKVAKNLTIPTTGLAGFLLAAKERGLITNVVPLMEELRNTGYWLSDELIDTAKQLAGE